MIEGTISRLYEYLLMSESALLLANILPLLALLGFKLKQRTFLLACNYSKIHKSHDAGLNLTWAVVHSSGTSHGFRSKTVLLCGAQCSNNLWMSLHA